MCHHMEQNDEKFRFRSQMALPLGRFIALGKLMNFLFLVLHVQTIKILINPISQDFARIKRSVKCGD